MNLSESVAVRIEEDEARLPSPPATPPLAARRPLPVLPTSTASSISLSSTASPPVQLTASQQIRHHALSSPSPPPPSMATPDKEIAKLLIPQRYDGSTTQGAKLFIAQCTEYFEYYGSVIGPLRIQLLAGAGG